MPQPVTSANVSPAFKQGSAPARPPLKPTSSNIAAAVARGAAHTKQVRTAHKRGK